VDFSARQVTTTLSKVSPVGRRQLQQLAGRDYILDVAHNPAAVTKLLEYIDVTNCNGKTIALFSVMADKDAKGMIHAASGRFDAWFLADQAANERAAPAADIAALLYEEGQSMVSVSKNLRQAFRRAQSLMVEGDRLVVFGSFYTVAAVLPLLDKDRRKGGA
jgi:dihydrofolate synthase/folylpolyglutamate synthase